ncbi:MAG: hypothetical protein L0H15_05965 [Nitrosospira sp.]|nr:hypothetical protein [Nitrosospira sp.]MDN5936379.1 hypothetical protein [Nitrosospira sp.]
MTENRLPDYLDHIQHAAMADHIADFERMTREIEQSLREADDPNAKFYTREEVMQAMQERIDRARDKPC